jgi:hypothetical protein
MRSGRTNSCGVGDSPPAMGVAWDAVPRAGNAAPYAPPGQTFEGAVGLERASWMKFSLRIVLVISHLLVSCAKYPVTQVTVEVADTSSGHFRLTPVYKARRNLWCSMSRVMETRLLVRWELYGLSLLSHPKKLDIVPENVHVWRSGDGSPVMITAEIP